MRSKGMSRHYLGKYITRRENSKVPQLGGRQRKIRNLK
jgi:hypothetical protein